MALWSPIQKAVGNSKDLAAYQRDITPEAVLQRAEIAKPPTLESNQDTRAANLDKFDGYNYTPVQVMGNLHPGSRNFMSLSMDTLELLARVPVCDAALGVRIGQVIKHGRLQKHPFEEGYRIKLREPQQQASPAARKRAQEISNWLRTCGDPRLRENATFQSFLASFVRDSMIYDQACAEVVYGYGREPAGFVPVDARTIRRAQPSTTEVNRQRQGPPRLVKGPPRYVQVLNNEITAQWEYDQFIFGVRNPRTDIRVSGYGYPELERLFTVVYDLVNAQSYNARNFTNGMHLNGVLALMSAMNKETFDAVSADFRGMAHGVSNAHRGMIMQLNPDLKEALQWIPMSASNSDMEFSSWIGFLLKLACAVLQMDPAELGFQFGNEGQSSSFASQGPGERVQLSKERGLYPILRNIEDWINDKIIHKIDPDFELVLAGYDQASELAKQEWIGKVIKTHYTVNEVRAIDDLDPIEGPAGNIILDGIYSSSVQYFDQQAQMQQQQQQQAEAELAMMGGGEEGGAPPISDEEIAAMFAEEPDAEAEIAKALTYSSDNGEVLEVEVW